MTKKLTYKQILFIDALMEGHDQQTAYKLAGYKGDGDTIKACASRLLANANVQAELKRRRLNVMAKASMTREEYIKRLVTLSEEAKSAGQYTAAKGAEELIGKTLGMLEGNNAGAQPTSLAAALQQVNVQVNVQREGDKPAVELDQEA